MCREIWLFKRYSVGIHYFYIYAKQRSKWNSGKYWIKLLLVISAHNHGICECITVWCVIEFLSANLLMLPMERCTRWNNYTGLLIGLEIQIGQLLFNCASSGFPNAALHATWHMPSSCCCSGVLLLHLSYCAVWVVWRRHEGAYVECCLTGASSSIVIENWVHFSSMYSAWASTRWTVGS